MNTTLQQIIDVLDRAATKGSNVHITSPWFGITTDNNGEQESYISFMSPQLEPCHTKSKSVGFYYIRRGLSFVHKNEGRKDAILMCLHVDEKVLPTSRVSIARSTSKDNDWIKIELGDLTIQFKEEWRNDTEVNAQEMDGK